MGDIIPLPPDRHQQTQRLLPWYVTGQLEAAERADVEAHLAGCAECQGELSLERRLQAEVAGLPVDVEHAWSSILQKVQEPRRRPGAALAAQLLAFARRAGRIAWTGAPWLGWGAAAGLGLVFLAAQHGPRSRDNAPYHALAATPSGPSAQLVVIFRPDSSEQAMREALRAANARMIDGPTAADAYVLGTPADQRQHALEILRARRPVVLAEPIDQSGPPR